SHSPALFFGPRHFDSPQGEAFSICRKCLCDPRKHKMLAFRFQMVEADTDETSLRPFSLEPPRNAARFVIQCDSAIPCACRGILALGGILKKTICTELDRDPPVHRLCLKCATKITEKKIVFSFVNFVLFKDQIQLLGLRCRFSTRAAAFSSGVSVLRTLQHFVI